MFRNAAIRGALSPETESPWHEQRLRSCSWLLALLRNQITTVGRCSSPSPVASRHFTSPIIIVIPLRETGSGSGWYPRPPPPPILSRLNRTDVTISKSKWLAKTCPEAVKRCRELAGGRIFLSYDRYVSSIDKRLSNLALFLESSPLLPWLGPSLINQTYYLLSFARKSRNKGNYTEFRVMRIWETNLNVWFRTLYIYIYTYKIREKFMQEEGCLGKNFTGGIVSKS